MAETNSTGFHRLTRAARKLVVVDLGFLGDTLHLVPALWELRRHYPQSEIHVVSSPLGAEVLRLAPCVDRVWALELSPAKRSWREQFRLVRALRREQFDAAFNFGGNDRTIILTALTGARWRVAHAGGRWHFWNRWLIRFWIPRQNPELTVYEQRRQVLVGCGMELGAVRFGLEVPAAVREWAAGLAPDGALHLSPNSANPFKEWPLGHHEELLRRLWAADPGLRVLVSAASNERETRRVEALFAAVNDPRLIRLPASLSITQLAAVVARCRSHVGPDSGVMHLAVALGIPTVSLFRAQGPYQSWLPVGAAHEVFVAPCSCVDHRDAPCEALGHARCLAELSPERVAEAVLRKLPRNAGG